jgi:hypothetical protein
MSNPAPQSRNRWMLSVSSETIHEMVAAAGIGKELSPVPDGPSALRRDVSVDVACVRVESVCEAATAPTKGPLLGWGACRRRGCYCMGFTGEMPWMCTFCGHLFRDHS